jgi:hypothetical protein
LSPLSFDPTPLPSQPMSTPPQPPPGAAMGPPPLPAAGASSSTSEGLLPPLLANVGGSSSAPGSAPTSPPASPSRRSSPAPGQPQKTPSKSAKLLVPSPAKTSTAQPLAPGEKPVVLGICSMDVKARSKAMREILTRLVEIEGERVDIKIFGDKTILDEGAWRHLLGTAGERVAMR